MLCKGGITKKEVKEFFRATFVSQKQRRIILHKWQHAKLDMMIKSVRPAHAFAAFIATLLYEKLSFNMQSDCFCVFGLPVRYEWIKHQQKHVLVDLFANSPEWFKTRKECENQMFEYKGFVIEDDDSIFKPIWRRQLVRDFVWFILAIQNRHLTLELVVALQHTLLDHTKDQFVFNLHAAMQGKMNIYEVLC